MLVVHKIRYHSRRCGDHDTPEESTDEANDNKGRERFRKRTRNDQNRENRKADHAYRLTPIDFAQRSHKHGSDSQTDEIECQAQSDDCFVLAEFIGNQGYA